MSQCGGSSGFKRKDKNGLIYKMEIDPQTRNKLMVTKVEEGQINWELGLIDTCYHINS